MRTIEVYDPPMCCSSGVCGPAADPKLVQFKAALKALESDGHTVRRFNPTQDQAAFAGNAQVNKAVETGGMGCLPLILVDGAIVSRGAYPELARLRELAAG
ncbi:MAG TPA: arsenite efflux transporter metallochaperone ArsD [Kiritimatiellia bacterium]|nr:arsenite efflux transporter metallochaperone ArsD [Kiritimatiellia bacterium]HMP34022.1 arsenite efflux transporter metallochaperone ArsD [Kiritimatiellia bacterium]